MPACRASPTACASASRIWPGYADLSRSGKARSIAPRAGAQTQLCHSCSMFSRSQNASNSSTAPLRFVYFSRRSAPHHSSTLLPMSCALTRTLTEDGALESRGQRSRHAPEGGPRWNNKIKAADKSADRTHENWAGSASLRCSARREETREATCDPLSAYPGFAPGESDSCSVEAIWSAPPSPRFHTAV